MEKVKETYILRIKKNNSLSINEILNLVNVSQENISINKNSVQKGYFGIIRFDKNDNIIKIDNTPDFITAKMGDGIYSSLLLNEACVDIFDIDSLINCDKEELDIIKKYHIENENYEILNNIKEKYDI